jgi:hypothetical protein
MFAMTQRVFKGFGSGKSDTRIMSMEGHQERWPVIGQSDLADVCRDNASLSSDSNAHSKQGNSRTRCHPDASSRRAFSQLLSLILAFLTRVAGVGDALFHSHR